MAESVSIGTLAAETAQKMRRGPTAMEKLSRAKKKKKTSNEVNDLTSFPCTCADPNYLSKIHESIMHCVIDVVTESDGHIFAKMKRGLRKDAGVRFFFSAFSVFHTRCTIQSCILTAINVYIVINRTSFRPLRNAKSVHWHLPTQSRLSRLVRIHVSHRKRSRYPWQAPLVHFLRQKWWQKKLRGRRWSLQAFKHPSVKMRQCLTLLKTLLRMLLRLSQSRVVVVVVAGGTKRRRSEKVNQRHDVYCVVNLTSNACLATTKHMNVTTLLHSCHAIELMNNKIP